MLLSVFSTLVLFLLGSVSAHAEAAPVPPVMIQGTVDRLVSGPNGRDDAVILLDHTVVQLHPQALSDPSILRAGDAVVVRGTVVLLKPNRVVDRVLIEKAGKTVLDDTKLGTPYEGIPAKALPRFRSISGTSNLLAVGARPNGDIDRVFLADGTVAQIPIGGFIDATRIQLGQRLTARGVGTSVPNGRYILSMELKGPDQVTLISTRAGFGEQWASKFGTVRQVLLTPQGLADGLLLTDNSAIRFYPIPPAEISAFSPGAGVQAAGPALANQLRTSFLVITNEDRVLAITPGGVISGSAPRQAAGIAARPNQPLKDTGRVMTVLRGSGNVIESLVLNDGARIRVPEHLRLSLPQGLKVGDTVEVTGLGGKYQEGTAIEANSVQRSG